MVHPPSSSGASANPLGRRTQPRPNIIAGPFEDQRKAFEVAHFLPIEGSTNSLWRSNADIRRHRRGWYVYLRSEATVHPGSKKWREASKERRAAR